MEKRHDGTGADGARKVNLNMGGNGPRNVEEQVVDWKPDDRVELAVPADSTREAVTKLFNRLEAIEKDFQKAVSNSRARSDRFDRLIEQVEQLEARDAHDRLWIQRIDSDVSKFVDEDAEELVTLEKMIARVESRVGDLELRRGNDRDDVTQRLVAWSVGASLAHLIALIVALLVAAQLAS